MSSKINSALPRTEEKHSFPLQLARPEEENPSYMQCFIQTREVREPDISCCLPFMLGVRTEMNLSAQNSAMHGSKGLTYKPWIKTEFQKLLKTNLLFWNKKLNPISIPQLITPCLRPHSRTAIRVTWGHPFFILGYFWSSFNHLYWQQNI